MIAHMIVGHSIIHDWRICHRQGFVAAKTTRHEKSGPAHVGQAFHAAFKAYGEHLRKTGQETDMDEAEKIILRCAAHISPEDANDLMYFGRDALLDFPWGLLQDAVVVEFERTMFVRLDNNAPLDPLAVDSALVDTHVFRGTPDLYWIDAKGVLNVLDLKTGHVVDHVQTPEASDQVRLYAAAILASTGTTQLVKLHLYHARTKFLETSGYVDPDTPPKMLTWEDLKPSWVAAQVAAEAMAAEPVKPTMTFGSHCTFCTFKVGCEAYAAHVFGAEESPSPEDALGELVALEGRVDTLRTYLRKELDTRTEIRSGMHKVTLVDEESSEFSKTATEELEKLLPRDDFLKTCKPTKTRLRDTMKKHKIDKAMVEAFITQHTPVERLTQKMKVKRSSER